MDEDERMNKEWNLAKLVRIISKGVGPYVLKSPKLGDLQERYYYSLDFDNIQDYVEECGDNRDEIKSCIFAGSVLTSLYKVFGKSGEIAGLEKYRNRLAESERVSEIAKARRKHVVIAENGRLGKYDELLLRLEAWDKRNDELISIVEENDMRDVNMDIFGRIILGKYGGATDYIISVREGLYSEKMAERIFNQSIPPKTNGNERIKERDKIFEEIKSEIIEKYFVLIKEVISKL